MPGWINTFPSSARCSPPLLNLNFSPLIHPGFFQQFYSATNDKLRFNYDFLEREGRSRENFIEVVDFFLMRRSTRISLHILETASSGKGAIRVNMCPLGGTLRELVLSLLPKEEARDWKLFARAHVPPLPWSSDARDAKRIFSRIIFTWGTFSPRRNILERVEYR